MSSEQTQAFTSTSTDPYTRGRELGEVHAQDVHGALARYRRLWNVLGSDDNRIAAVGNAVLEPTRAFAPHLYDEMRGIADGAGLGLAEVGAVNARTELLAGLTPASEECTTCVRLPQDDAAPVTIQTWDWHDALADSWFVWTLPLADGTTVRTMTEYGIVGKIGATTRGLSLHFNALGHRADTGDGGVPVHVVARRVLDEAGTVDDAVRIAREAEVSASSSLTVTARGASGGWACVMIELHPGGPTVVAGASPYVVHTNHFLGVPESDQVHRPGTTTYERMDYVTVAAPKHEPYDRGSLEEMLDSHDFGYKSVCSHVDPAAAEGERSATLAVAYAEPASGALAVHPWGPCQRHNHD